MGAPIVQFGGGTSSIELYEDYVVIKPSNIQNFHGQTHTIPLDSVVTVSIVRNGLSMPYLQIVTPGMITSKKDAMKGAEANVVLIQPGGGRMDKAKKIQAYILQYKARPKQQASTREVGIDSLEKLAELQRKGIITQAEFEAAKRRILGI